MIRVYPYFEKLPYSDTSKFLQMTILGLGKLEYRGVVMPTSGEKHVETLQVSSDEHAGRSCTVTVLSDL